MCAIITSRTFLACDFTLADLTAAFSTGVATTSSLVELQFQDTEEHMQCRHDNVRLTESRNTRSEQLVVVPTEKLTDCKWLPGEPLNGSKCTKAWMFFKYIYEISDLLSAVRPSLISMMQIMYVGASIPT